MVSNISFRQIAWVAFACALGLLVLIAVGTYRTTKLLVASENWVSHTHQVQAVLQDLRANIIGAEYSRRGYTITGDEALLKDYRKGVSDIPVEIQRLRELTTGNPLRKPSFDDLEALVDRSLDLQEGAVESRRSGHPNMRQDIEITRQTAELADRTNAVIAAIEGDENRLLAERRAQSDLAYTHTLRVLAGGFFVVLFLLGAEFYLLNLEFKRHEKTAGIARRNEELLNAFFSSSSVGFGMLDKELRLRRMNGVLSGMTGVGAGDVAGKPVTEILGETGENAAKFRAVVSDGQTILDHEVCHSAGDESRYWLVNCFPIADNRGHITQAGLIVVDVTERRNAQTSIQRLSARLITLQDQERRRIARNLHDSLGQYLTSAKITLAMLDNPAFANKQELLSDCGEMLDRCITETRTISHLLHPPLLDEAGFASAANWYVSGFAERSGIDVALNLPSDLPRMPNEVEIALFRVLQESLTNVHRHSQSKSAEIYLQSSGDRVTLKVCDHGRGIPAQRLKQMTVDGTQSGVGLAGMRERVHELGGQFELQSNGEGTTLVAEIPLTIQPQAKMSSEARAGDAA